MQEDIVIISAVRTAIGRFGGSLAKVSAPDLGSIVIKEALKRAGVGTDQVGEVIMGNVLAAGLGQNPARQAAMKAGVAKETPSMTINTVCGSGLKAVMLAAQAVATGDSEIVVAGGQENMSAAPHLLPNSRDGQRMGDWKLIDSMIVDGLWDIYNQYHMGITAENVAKQEGITRQMQDELALASQKKALDAQTAGRFKDEIVPVSVPQRRGDPVVFDADEHINAKTSAEALQRLRPAFDRSDSGTVTAGNASGINDGAAAVVVTTAKKAAELGAEPLAFQPIFDEAMQQAQTVLPLLADVSAELHQAQQQGTNLLFEGAQGTMLDIDHGTYPYVTSSNCVAGNAAAGSGVGPGMLHYVLGITKAYCTRVGSGPFPTELDWQTPGTPGYHMSHVGAEKGVTTGRDRRCGWFDAALLKRSAQVNGLHGLCITKLDVLDGLHELKICTGYELDGRRVDLLPLGAEAIARCKPVYEVLPGWQETTFGVTDYAQLPANARAYLDRMQELCGVPIALVSTGPDRDQTIVLHDPFAPA